MLSINEEGKTLGTDVARGSAVELKQETFLSQGSHQREGSQFKTIDLRFSSGISLTTLSSRFDCLVLATW